MFEVFNWRGKPIVDIEKWAQDRGERMVCYKAKRQTPYGPEEFESSMPESFWNSLLWNNGWQYEELNAN